MDLNKLAHDADFMIGTAIMEGLHAAHGDKVQTDWIVYHERRVRTELGLGPAPRSRKAYARNRLLAKLKSFADRAAPVPVPSNWPAFRPQGGVQ